MSESLPPRSIKPPEIRYQPSMLSAPPGAANTVPPEQAARRAAQEAKSKSWRKLWFFIGVSALVGAGAFATLRGPGAVTPRIQSGTPSYKLTKDGHQVSWQKPGVTIYLDGSLARLGPQANEAVMQAFGEWVGSDPKLPSLSFDSGQTSSQPVQDGKSTVSYASIQVPGHEKDVAITVTYASDQTGEIVEADVILNALYPMGVLTAKPQNVSGVTANGNVNADGTSASGSQTSMLGESESMDCQNRYDAQNVVTHEAGHFFGLGEDMTERRATMFLSIDQCETHKRVLSSTDVGAMTNLYAASQGSEQAGSSGAGCSFGAAPAGAGAGLISGLLLGLGLVRRRAAR